MVMMMMTMMMAVLTFGIGDNNDLFEVPFLITEQEISTPIIGYNTIEHLVTNYRSKLDLPASLCLLVEALSAEKAEAVVNLVEQGAEIDELRSPAKLERDHIVFPGQYEKVRCRMRDLKMSTSGNKLVMFAPLEELCVEGELVVFESVDVLKTRRKFIDIMVYNPTKEKIYLSKGKLMGEVSNAAAAHTLPILEKIATVSSVDVEEQKKSIREMVQECGLSFDNLTEVQREEVLDVLEEEGDVFSRTKNDIGHIPDFKLEIKVTDDKPFGEAYRKIPGTLYNEVKAHVSDMLANGWIRQSYSPYSSPMVCARKKDGGLRLCIDFRKLNAKTIPDMQPIPRVQDILDRLHGQEWFSTVDMSQAYHQGEMHENSRKLTAFSTPWALYEWVRVPYGVMNAPAGFQRFINGALLNLDNVSTAYLDDVLIYSKTFDEHLRSVKSVLKQLKEKGVKLNLRKCSFFKQEIRFLGRLVSKEGYRPDPKDVEALQACKIPPENIGKVRSLLGFLGYYRTYVEGFSKKMKPVYDLLQMEEEDKKGDKTQLDKKKKVKWTAEHQKAVEEMVDYLSSGNVIAYPDFEQPFIVHTDASQEGLGAALYQVQDGRTRIISLASRTLTPAERNYHMHSGKLEFLALKWAVTEKFHDYLINGQDFEVVTDNNPLTYVMSSAKLHATGLRWVAALANYRFSIKYRAGKKHVDADYLSRDIAEKFRKYCEGADKNLSVEDTSLLLSAAARKEDEVDVNLVHVNTIGTEEVGTSDNRIGKEKLKEAQIADKVIGPVYQLVKEGGKFSSKELEECTGEVKILHRQIPKMRLENGVLVRETATLKQLVLPECFQKLVFDELHVKLGHLGPDRVEELAKRRFYWPRMRETIDRFVTKQCRCIASKKPNIPDRAPLVPIVSTYPFEMLTIDYLHLDKAGGYEYALVCCDHFTKFVQIYPTRNKSALAAADRIYNDLVLKYGMMERIHHDQGREFENSLFKRLNQLAGIQRSKTTPYHPMGNGLCERMNRTLLNMLKALSEKEKTTWPKHLAKLAFAYNVTEHSSTGFSPYFLLFGKQPRLPIDSIFEIEDDAKIRKSYQRYADDWKKAMNQAFDIVRKNKEAAGKKNKVQYDRKARGNEIKTGDRVLTRNREQGGTGKLRSFWEEKVYKVVEAVEGIPVFVIKPENGGRSKRVHRNDILRCNLILPMEEEGPRDNSMNPSTVTTA